MYVIIFFKTFEGKLKVVSVKIFFFGIIFSFKIMCFMQGVGRALTNILSKKTCSCGVKGNNFFRPY